MRSVLSRLGWPRLPRDGKVVTDRWNWPTHGELTNFIWSISNLLSGPYKRNECRKAILLPGSDCASPLAEA